MDVQLQIIKSIYDCRNRGRRASCNDALLEAYAAKTAYDVKPLTSLNPRAFEGATKEGNNPKLNGLNLQLGIGGSSASNQMSTYDETARVSNIRSRCNVTIAATGGDLDIIGSQVSDDNVADLAKFTEQLAGRSAFAADGTPLMDFSKLTNAQKGVVGELIGGEKSQLFMTDAQRIGRLPAVGQQGIDDLFKVNRPDVDYVVVEYKFGSSKLGNTADGVQMSDSWLTGDKTRNNRIFKSVGDDALASDIRNSLDAGRVERWLVNTDPYGNVSVGLLDKNGKFIPDPERA